MTRARQLVGVSATSAASTVWLSLLGLVTTPYLLNALGAPAYGVFALITIMSAYLANLELGFGHALVRFLARAVARDDPVEQDRVLNTSFAVFLFGGLIAATIGLLGAEYVIQRFAEVPASIEEVALVALRLGMVILLFSFLSSFFSAALAALGSYAVVVGIRTAAGTLASISAISIVALGGALDTVMLGQVAVGLVNCVALGVALARKRDTRVRPRAHMATFRRLARFGALVLVAGIAYQAMLQGPPTVLAGHASTAQVAAYAVPATVLQQLVLLITATSLSFLPFASAASADASRTRLGAVYRSNLRLTMLAIGPVAAYLAVFATPLLSTWIGDEFAATAAGPMRFLALGAVMLALSAAPVDVARGLGHPGWVVCFTVAAAAIEIVAALSLVGSRGASGVALGLLLGLAAAVLPFMAIVARRLLSIPVRALARSLAGPALAVAGVSGAYLGGLALDPGFGVAVGTGVLATGAYAFLSYRFVLDDRERRAVRTARLGT